MNATPPLPAPLPSGAWYALRRTLPPWRFDELLAELVAHSNDYGLDEVMVMVDAEECFHGHPSPAIAAEHAVNLMKIKTALSEIGVAYSLNPWITRGHEDRCRVAADTVQGIQTVVEADGKQATCIACLLSPAWRDNFAQVWTYYAKTQPRVLWLEDDFRDFGNHACFCPLHLARFSQIIGRPVTREEAVAALRQPGPPHPWRKLWLEMQAEAALEVLRLAESTVRAVSPATTLGLMSSGPRNHVCEGRDWLKVAKAMGATDERPICSRPTMGNYWEWGPPHGLYFSQDSIKITRHCFPANSVDMTEVESVPFSRYAKSVAFMNATLAVTFAFGARGATLNIFDHLGSLMESEPHYGKALAAQKPFLNGLAANAQLPGVLRGVRLYFNPDSAAIMHLPPEADAGGNRAEGYPGMEAFEAAGIPTTYDDSEVLFLSGQQPHNLADDELLTLLSKGLFLDATAAALLCDRGFGPHIGLESVATPVPLHELGAFSAESISNPAFGGAPYQFVTAQLPQVSYDARVGILTPVPGAEIIGHLVDPDVQPVHPAMTAFANTLGGRVIVHTWDYASAIGPIGVSFHHPLRQKQLHAAVRWLFGGKPPLLVSGDGAWPLAFRKDCADGIMLGLINLSLDPWPGVEFEFHLPQAVEAPAILECDGSWQPTTDAVVLEGKLVVNRPVTLQQPLVLWLAYRGTGM
jgi:hypothetical protein